eukprot:1577842-Amphidinium_carterae.1
MALSGVWMAPRSRRCVLLRSLDERPRARAFDADPACVFCKEGFGTPHHVVFECPVFAQQRKEAKVGVFREDVPACVQTYGLGI